MEFAIDCKCGGKVDVNDSQAGSKVACKCGRLNSVPTLSELRRIAGLQRYEIGIADKIIQLLADKKLPFETACIVCHQHTEDVLLCTLECERLWSKRNGYLKTLFLTLIAPVWAFRDISKEYSNPEIVGRELVLKIPLRLCKSCSAAQNSNRKNIFALLNQVPLYSELLLEYPKTTLITTQ